MREIKFRAWHKDEKFMSPITKLWWDEQIIETIGEMEGERNIRHFDEVELMQFTGVKDKNGQEIYEGDIVKNYHYESGVIKYKEGAFFVCSWRCFSLIFDGSHSPEKLKVIGNIYDAPELLEGVLR